MDKLISIIVSVVLVLIFVKMANKKKPTCGGCKPNEECIGEVCTPIVKKPVAKAGKYNVK